jgi:23S rRNA pseudouridine2605 synthase
VLARAGLGSRRKIEAWISEGRVTVDGARVELGARVGPSHVIRLDGRRLRLPAAREATTRVLRYHKVVGEVCTRSDPQGRPTVFARLPPLRSGRWVTVGRLDVSSSGLLLVTNDGGLANRLMHPSSGLEREYAVRVFGEVTPEMLERLQTGVTLEDGEARFESIAAAGGEGLNRWYRVTLREGRKREVRRLWESQGVRVSRLIRVRYGAVQLPRGLRRGAWDELSAVAVRRLMAVVGLGAPRAAQPRSAGTRRRPARRR